MATGTSEFPTPPPAPATPPPPPTQADPYDHFIRQRLDKTRWHVKLVDIASGLILLAIGILAWLLVLAVIDHWIFDLGYWGRVFGLLALVGGVVYFIAVKLAAPVLHPISPVYAAHAIEEAEPSLKNSLVNFLLLRNNRAGVRNVVFHAVEKRAADDLTQVRVESTVNWARVTRFGYVLAAVLLLCVLYKPLLGKDPLQTVQRVMMPWSRIDRPSTVTIDDVRPGNTQIYQGRVLEVSAQVFDLAPDEPVDLYYSTADGQIVDRRVGMRQSEVGRFECSIPPAEDGDRGVQQSLVYHIEAGDAVSSDYRVEVVPAPSIVVHEVRYRFPAYTQRETVVQPGKGDVSALEGTEVTIVARANLDIQSAHLQFDPAGDGIGAGAVDAGSLESDIKMVASGKDARVSFVLDLQPDRRTPVHHGYQLWFETQAGHRSDQPVQHRIEVLPDLPPEIEILKPERREVEVPEDGKLTIEVRANDADFGLAKMTLHGVSGDVEVLTAELLDESEGVAGQVIRQYEFRPQGLGLVAGDTATVWAVAVDNRTAPKTNQAAGNSAKTPNYAIRITEPEDMPGNRDEQSPEADDLTDPREQDSPSENQPKDGSDSQDGQQTGEGSDEDRQEGEEGQPEESDGRSSSGGENSGEDQSDGGQSGDGIASDGQPQDGGSSAEQPGQNGSDAGDRQSGSPQGTDNSDSEGGQPSEADGQGSRPQASDGQTGSRQPSEGGAGGEPGEQQPYDHTGSEDGNIVERLSELRRDRQQDGSPSRDGGQPQPGDQDNPSESGNPADTDQQLAGDPRDSQRPNTSGTGTDQDQGQPRETEGAGSSQGTDPHQSEPESGAGQDDANRQPGEGDRPEQSDAQEGAGDQQGEGSRRQSGSPDGEGGKPQGGDVPQDQDSQSDQSGSQKPGTGDNDQSGAGSPPSDDEGAPESQGGREQRRGDQPSPGGQNEPKDPQEAKSPGTSKKPSQSHDGNAGDRKGGGEQGGGQGSKQPGHDSAGSNSGAQEGAGADEQPGDGQTSEGPGGRQPADKPSGQPGSEKGPGSTSRPNSTGRTPGGTSDGEPPQPGAEGPESASDASGGSPGSQGRGRENSTPSRGGYAAGGGPQGRGDADNPPEGAGRGGDPANLKYAREETVLALDQLEHMSDEEVREEFGWEPEQRREFDERLRKMLRESDGADGAANRRREKFLKSLGLRPQSQRLERGGATTDELPGVQDSSQSSPPPEYEELFNAFKRGVSRAGADQPSE